MMTMRACLRMVTILTMIGLPSARYALPTSNPPAKPEAVSNPTTGRVSLSDLHQPGLQQPGLQHIAPPQTGTAQLNESSVLNQSSVPGLPTADGKAVNFSSPSAELASTSYVVTSPGELLSESADFVQQPPPSPVPPAYFGIQPQMTAHESLARPQSAGQTEYPTLRWSGFLQIDTGDVAQDEQNIASVGKFDASTGLRRVRLRADGKIHEQTSYVIDLDFAASGHPSFRNVGLTFHQTPVFDNVQAGLLKTPFGMDAMTSGRELLFMERQLPFALVPFRQIMAGARSSILDDRATWEFAAFRMPTDSFGVYEGGDKGLAAAGRLTASPIYEQDGSVVLHLGAGYSVGSSGDGVIQYRIQPGFFSRDPGTDAPDPGTVPVFLDTGQISTDLFQLFNLEAGANYGPFHISTEIRWSALNQKSGPDLLFPGFYVQSSYVLTGEHHGYSRTKGVFQRVDPARPFIPGQNSGSGAIEVALGWSWLDLNDQNISGGQAATWAIGVNWYLTESSRFQLNVLPASLNKPGVGESHATVFAMRAQVEF